LKTNPQTNFQARPVFFFLAVKYRGNSQLPNCHSNTKMLPAMGFANPFKGEPPDDFRANNSYRTE
jgi:hypothetical protein